jgi:hypothetical protein
VDSRNFTLTVFSEVRYLLATPSYGKDTLFGGCARPYKPDTVLPKSRQRPRTASRRSWAPRGVGSQWCNRLPQEDEGGPDEDGTEGSCGSMNTRAVKVLAGVVLVLALMLVALVLLVPDLSWAGVLHFMTTSNGPCGDCN